MITKKKVLDFGYWIVRGSLLSGAVVTLWYVASKLVHFYQMTT